MRRILAAFLVAMFGVVSSTAQATTNSNKVDVALSAQILTSYTIVIATPAVAFGVVTPNASNAAPAGQAISVVSAWSLTASNTVKLYAYFDTATSAMTGTLSGALIPTADITASVNGGSSAAFTSVNPFGGSALAMQVYSQSLTALTAVSNRTDSVALTMNLTGQGSLQADNYTGVVHFQGQAM